MVFSSTLSLGFGNFSWYVWRFVLNDGKCILKFIKAPEDVCTFHRELFSCWPSTRFEADPLDSIKEWDVSSVGAFGLRFYSVRLHESRIKVMESTPSFLPDSKLQCFSLQLCESIRSSLNLVHQKLLWTLILFGLWGLWLHTV